MKFIFTFCFVLIAQLFFSQGMYPELTSKVGEYESPTLEKRVESIFQKKLKSNPKEEINLKLWKLYIYDSLGISGKADTLALDLTKSTMLHKYLESSIIFSRLGNIEADNNEFKKAISYYHSGLKIARKFNNIKIIGSFQRMIGTSYLKLVQNKTAEKYLRESLSSYKSINDSLGMANASISLGNAMKAQENLKEGIKYYQMSLDLAKKLDNQRLIAGNYNNLGSIERRQKNYKKALDYFFKALDMNLKSNNKQWQSFNLHNIAMTYEDMNQYNDAIEFFKKSNDIKTDIGDSLSLITGYESLSSAYAKVNDFENAYDFLKLHIKLKDTLNLVEQARLLESLEVKYQSAQKESEISRLKMTNELEVLKHQGLEMKAQKNANLLTLAIFAGLILLGGVGLLLRSNKSRRIANDLLNSKNEIMLYNLL
jgi:tetratricopeptide (TPR) repeat protein